MSFRVGSKALAEGAILQRDNLVCELLGCENTIEDLSKFKGRLSLVLCGKTETYYLDGKPLITFYPPDFQIEETDTSIKLLKNQKYKIHEQKATL